MLNEVDNKKYSCQSNKARQLSPSQFSTRLLAGGQFSGASATDSNQMQSMRRFNPHRFALIRFALNLGLVIFCVLALKAGEGALFADDRYTGNVERVIDGDTVDVMTSDYERIRVRLYGIDAPERNQSGGGDSTALLKDLIDHKQVEVRVLDIDRYSRQVGLIYLDGKSVNLAMVAQGQAWVYDSYCKQKDVCQGFRQAQDEARKARLGLWADPDPTAPWDHRRNRRKSQS